MRDEAIVSPGRKEAEALAKKLSGLEGTELDAKPIAGAPVVTGSHDSAPAGEKH